MLFENQSPAPKPIEDVEKYLNSLRTAGERTRGNAANLHRSEFFRHKEDYDFFIELVNDAIENGKPLKFLEIGVGNMEEPVSFLATAYANSNGMKLEDIVDMEIVELEKKENRNTNYRLGKKLFFDSPSVKPPKTCENSFSLIDGEYEVADEIKEYLSRRIDDESKAHFNTPIENFASSTNTKYDVVACNNVLQHMGGHESYESPLKNGGQKNARYAKYYEELLEILSLVKEGGIIFIHTPSSRTNDDGGAKKILAQLPSFSDDFEELALEIYRRKIKNTRPAENKI